MELSELSALVRQCEAAVQWQRVKEKAVEFFGDQVAKLDVDYYNESDDEGGSYRSISGIAAYDANGQQLEIDQSLLRQRYEKNEAGRAEYRLAFADIPGSAEWYKSRTFEAFVHDFPEDGWAEEGFSDDDCGEWDLTTVPDHPDISMLVWLDHTESGERHE